VRPEDFAALVAILASDDSAFITGESSRCDGGLTSHRPFFADLLEGTTG
jgi:NAD(P)-dependent dehydrogenase (short-subunit alcohol dehydrogenase family)